MDVLNNAIKSFVKGFLDEAAKRVADKFEISTDEALAIWSDLYVDMGNIKATPLVKKSDKKADKPKKKKAVSDSDDESGKEESSDEGCCHKMLRGPRSGNSCGEKISKKSQTGHYCNKHIAHENKTKSEKKSKKEIQEGSEKRETRHTISKNKFGNYTHVPTGLVFKSAQEKVVYGKQDEEGEIHDLTEEDIQMCKKFKFPFKNTCSETKNPKGESDKEEGNEEDDVEEENDNE